ncbi:roadblock/LC7 domain-containing protein [Streptomyces paludis]|uniref:Dynein regulation protein LC7 n=1 Tax=Streptomyces paludis TaxID=2282738 RepID=A0A345HX79_9ACTN|nr:roadblock/LC7 domain-containing protein [Streptomyces paludis]AXG81303.1 dynein regulation protein LC7 [Streptomyces paludis]
MHADSPVTSPVPLGSLVEVLASLRERVMGASESVLSTADGLLVAADTDTVQPEAIAALAAATLGLGARMAQQADAGALRDVVIRCGGGQVIVLAVGDRALLSILGDEGIDVAALQRQAPVIVEELLGLLAADVAS